MNRNACAALALGLAAVVVATPAAAHELRPAFVDLEETADAVEITTTWPLVEMAPRRIEVRLPPGCVPASPPSGEAPKAEPAEPCAVEHTRHLCPGVSLAGAEISFDGLTVSVPEVVVHARLRDGTVSTVVARRERPAVVLGRADGPAGAVSFVELGVRHILSGADHLLFVLGLVLLVLRRSAFAERGLAAVPWRRLLAAVTAFTCAHSVTLALAATGALALPPRGVEATIALSIVALALELARTPNAGSSSSRRPWLLAFGFGLLHGFGFAGALGELGLSRASILSPLLRFNVGVEIGQLAFVAACLAVLSAVQRVASKRLPQLSRALLYAMGSLAMFWVFGRTLAILG
jgi:hypothetical protein